MYSIEKKSYGYHLVFSDFISADEMAKWVSESEAALANGPSEYGAFVDMRQLKPLAPDAQSQMQSGQKLYKEKGMVRSVVILNDAVTTLQFKRIARETGIAEWERYIDASTTADWEAKGVAWLTDGTEP